MHTHYYYRWCTMGGVERTLLNRALILRRTDSSFGMTISFLDGAPSLDLFQRALQCYGLSGKVRVTEGIPPDAELVVAIDAPNAVPQRRPGLPFIVECHTTYDENQNYLASLPDWVQTVVVPSEGLAQQLMRKRLVHTVPLVLPNIMPHPAAALAAPSSRIWPRRPVAYVGRLDAWKNTEELLRLWRRLAALRPDVFFILAGPQTGDTETLAALRDAGILDTTLRLPAVPFEAVPRVLALVRDHRGLVVSASKGESFGWMAAEAIVEGVPILLSDNAGHRDLVQDDRRFLYTLGNPVEGAEAAAMALSCWEDRAAALGRLTHRITDEQRLNSAWAALCGHLRSTASAAAAPSARTGVCKRLD